MSQAQCKDHRCPIDRGFLLSSWSLNTHPHTIKGCPASPKVGVQFISSICILDDVSPSFKKLRGSKFLGSCMNLYWWKALLHSGARLVQNLSVNQPAVSWNFTSKPAKIETLFADCGSMNEVEMTLVWSGGNAGWRVSYLACRKGLRKWMDKWQFCLVSVCTAMGSILDPLVEIMAWMPPCRRHRMEVNSLTQLNLGRCFTVPSGLKSQRLL